MGRIPDVDALEPSRLSTVREQLNIRTTPEFLEALDRWRRNIPRSKIPSRTEAIQELVLWAIKKQKL